MSAFNALIDGYGAAPDPGPPPTDSNAGATQGAAMGPAPVQNAADLQGTSPLFGQHNTPLHVAFLGLIALGVVIALRLAGFRFSVAGAGGLGLGGR